MFLVYLVHNLLFGQTWEVALQLLDIAIEQAVERQAESLKQCINTAAISPESKGTY